MTVEEKAAQLLIDNSDYDSKENIILCFLLFSDFESNFSIRSALIQRYNQTGFGSTYIFSVSDVNQRNKLQSFIMHNSRLQIPVTFPTEGLHSGTFRGTIFPAPCGMSSTWNPGNF